MKKEKWSPCQLEALRDGIVTEADLEAGWPFAAFEEPVQIVEFPIPPSDERFGRGRGWGVCVMEREEEV